MNEKVRHFFPAVHSKRKWTRFSRFYWSEFPKLSIRQKYVEVVKIKRTENISRCILMLNWRQNQFKICHVFGVQKATLVSKSRESTWKQDQNSTRWFVYHFLSLFIHYVLTSTLKSSTNLLQLHNYSNLFTLISDVLNGMYW